MHLEGKGWHISGIDMRSIARMDMDRRAWGSGEVQRVHDPIRTWMFQGE